MKSQALPSGWIRDKRNPGVIKLSGKKAEEHNQHTMQIKKLEDRIERLEIKVNMFLNKLNK
jgi:hypothetical protein